MGTTDTESATASIRHDLIETAVKFMQNPSVTKTTLSEQQHFLRRKGLTDAEIHMACEKSGAYEKHRASMVLADSGPNALIGLHPGGSTQVTIFSRFREFLHNIAIFSVVAYLLYKFYEKFIAPFLFGKRKKTVEEKLEELTTQMNTSITELNTNLTGIQVELNRINGTEDSTSQRHLNDLKSDISTVKGLLLNRHQFPPMSKSISSLPDWQKIGHDFDQDSDGDRKAEDLMDACSATGSEPCTKTSESSLEIISYSSKESDYRRCKGKDDVDDDDDNEFDAVKEENS